MTTSIHFFKVLGKDRVLFVCCTLELDYKDVYTYSMWQRLNRLIDWLVFNANISNISAISWHWPIGIMIQMYSLKIFILTNAKKNLIQLTLKNSLSIHNKVFDWQACIGIWKNFYERPISKFNVILQAKRHFSGDGASSLCTW